MQLGLEGVERGRYPGRRRVTAWESQAAREASQSRLRRLPMCCRQQGQGRFVRRAVTSTEPVLLKDESAWGIHGQV